MNAWLRVSLLAFGIGIGVPPAAGQPDAVGQWSFVQPLPLAPVHTHLLPTGVVMIWSADGTGNDPRLWNPVTEAVSTPAQPGFDLFCAGHAFLADGRLLVTGGHIAAGVGLARASIYNPFTDVWTSTPDMNAGRWYPTTTTLGNGDALVVSGAIDVTVGSNTLPQVFQPSSGVWRDLTNARLSQGYYPFMFLAPNGQVFHAGPSTTTRYLDTSGTGAWTMVANRNGPGRSAGSAVMYADGKVLVVGGSNPPTNTAEVIDLNQSPPAWRWVAPMAFARRDLNTTILPDGTVLVTGGRSVNDQNSSVYAAELWDPATETWTVMASQLVPRLYHSGAILLPDGKIFTVGGNPLVEAEVYSPPYLFKGPRPTISSAPTNVGYGRTFFVETPDAASIAQVTWIRLSSVTHSFNQNQRINHLSFSPAAGGLDVRAPASGNLAPPGHYMLFILNGNGVPSVAKILRIDAAAPPTPAPTLASLSPSSAPTGGPGFALTLTGSNFVSDSTVQWNGASRQTTFVSEAQLNAVVPATDIATSGTVQVTVVNPGAGTSGALAFTIASPPTATLSVSKNGTGKGTVTSTPAGITCGRDCAEAYSRGQTVTLTAAPAKNVVFDGWSGACSGTATCTITMETNITVTATFTARRR